jgi:Ca-activated chloride channel homolog
MKPCAGSIGDSTRKGANIRVEKDVVLVPVSVVDQDNRPVRGLQGKQFRLFDNKVEQSVSSFWIDDEPLAVGIVFDTSRSIGKDLNRSRLAAKAFLMTANPEDDFLLVELNDRATLTVPLTNDLERIEARLASSESRGRTALLDGIYLGLTEIKRSKKSRKALLVISDGNDNHSRIAQRELTKLIPESDVLIYVIGIFAPLEFLNPEELPGARLLGWIAEQTGGRLYTGEPRKLPEIAKDIGVELRNRYVIGFSPTDQEHDGRYHRVQIRIIRTRGLPAMLPSWRQGYYAPSD